MIKGSSLYVNVIQGKLPLMVYGKLHGNYSPNLFPGDSIDHENATHQPVNRPLAHQASILINENR